MRLRLVWLVLILFVAACEQPHDLDSGGIDATNNDAQNDGVEYGDPMRLGLVGQDPILLTAGETKEVVVRLTSDGAPVAGHRVAFAILGDAGGSILSASSVITNGDGRASVNLTAGKSSAEFQLRVTAQGAPDLYVEVIVSESGFTEVSVITSMEVPDRYIAPTRVEVGVLIGEWCPGPMVEGDLSYPRYETAIPEVIEYPELPPNRPVSVVVRAEVDGDLELGGCVTIPADEMVAHGKATATLEIVPYDPQLPSDATCTVSVDATEVAHEVAEDHSFLVGAGQCPYGLATTLVDELVSKGWMCLEQARGQEVDGCRTGGLEEEMTEASTALEELQEALACVAGALDGTPSHLFDATVIVGWTYTSREDDLNHGILDVTLPYVGEGDATDVLLSVDGTKIGGAIYASGQSVNGGWKALVTGWVEDECLASIGQPLSEEVIIDYAGERIESESLDAIHDVLCIGAGCCPPISAIEDAWYALRNKTMNSARNPLDSDTKATASVRMDVHIEDEGLDSEPEGISCSGLIHVTY